MNTISPRVAASLATALLILVLSLAATAQVANDPRRDNDPIVIPPGRAELVYRQAEEIPRQLRTVLRCSESWLSEIPVRVVRPTTNAPLIVLAPCGSIVDRGIAFTIGRFFQPEPVGFIVMAAPSGFMTVRNPGHLEWHADTGTLTARHFTDVCPSDEVRYSYRHNRSEAPFTLMKIERRPAEACAGPGPYTVVWEAQEWQTK